MAPLISTMPALPLDADCTVEWVAIDPTTGADVSNVKITNPTLYGIDLSGSSEAASTVADTEPKWLPLPVSVGGNVSGSA
jgi:hypothetical protein